MQWIQEKSLYKKFFDNYFSLKVPSEEGAWMHLEIPSDVNSILDVGCGAGEFLNSLPSRYKRYGMDIVENQLKKISYPTVVGNADNIPFESGSFDLVTCFEVLEHLSYSVYPKAVSELERVSKKYIAVSVPNRQNLLQSLVECPLCHTKFNADFHVRSFGKKDLMSLFPSCEMISVKECGPYVRSFPHVFNRLFGLLRKSPPIQSICPLCEFSAMTDKTFQNTEQSVEKNSGLKGCIVKKIIKTLFLRFDKRPYWLIALYKKK